MNLIVNSACPKCNHTQYEILETLVVTPKSEIIKAITVFPNADTNTDYSSKDFFEENIGKLNNRVEVKVKCLNCSEIHNFIIQE